MKSEKSVFFYEMRKICFIYIYSDFSNLTDKYRLPYNPHYQPHEQQLCSCLAQSAVFCKKIHQVREQAIDGFGRFLENTTLNTLECTLTLSILSSDGKVVVYPCLPFTRAT
jgi:hypothetical protein